MTRRLFPLRHKKVNNVVYALRDLEAMSERSMTEHAVLALKALAVNARSAPSKLSRRLFVLRAPVFEATVTPYNADWLEIEHLRSTYYVSSRFAQSAPRWSIDETPWVSQLGLQASRAHDCGQACVLMLLRKFNSRNDLTVDDLSAVKSGRTTWLDLKRLAEHFNLTLTPSPYEHLVREDERRRIGIALVNYRDLGISPLDNPASRRDPGLHWVVVVGAYGGYIYIHDPLWAEQARGGIGGAYIPIPKAQFMRAYRASALSI